MSETDTTVATPRPRRDHSIDDYYRDGFLIAHDLLDPALLGRTCGVGGDLPRGQRRHRGREAGGRK
jgi:hypothetical protein